HVPLDRPREAGRERLGRGRPGGHGRVVGGPHAAGPTLSGAGGPRGTPSRLPPAVPGRPRGGAPPLTGGAGPPAGAPRAAPAAPPVSREPWRRGPLRGGPPAGARGVRRAAGLLRLPGGAPGPPPRGPATRRGSGPRAVGGAPAQRSGARRDPRRRARDG